MASLLPVGQPGHVPIVPQQEASTVLPDNAKKTQEVALALIPAPSHDLGKLPRDVLNLVLRELSSRDLQSLRLDRYLNNQVIGFVHGQNIQLFQGYIDFLLVRFPDLRALLETPPEKGASLNTRNLVDCRQSLYNARSRLIDILESLEPATLDAFEQAFRKTGLSLPSKCEHLFELTRLQATATDEDLGRLDSARIRDLNEGYEGLRMCQKHLTAGNRALIAEWVNTFHNNNSETRDMILRQDKATFCLLEEIINSFPDGIMKDNALVLVHSAHGAAQIRKNCIDDSVESISTIIQRLNGPFWEGSQHRQDACRRAVDFLLYAAKRSKIDDASSEKLFASLKSLVPYLSPQKQDEYLLQIMSLQITACVSWGSIGRLQTLTNELLEYIESTPDVSKKALIVLNWLQNVQRNLIEPVNHRRQEPNPTALLVGTLQHTKDCDAKYGLLAVIRWFELYPRNARDEEYLGIINKIKDSEFRMRVVIK